MGTVDRTTRMSVGAGVALPGITLVLISTGFHAQALARRPSFDTPVSAGALDRANIDANNSPALAQDPRQASVLALANGVDTTLYSCALSVSHDGGATWTSVAVPLARGEHECYAPDVAFGADGTLYRLALISDDSHAVAAWADTRYGTLATNKQVIESASPSFTAQSGLPAPVRDVLRYGGIALLLAGLAATGSSLLRS